MADLNDSRYFSDHEFEGRTLEVAHADQRLFERLDTYRERLGEVIHPSPVPGALTRFDGSERSMHFSDQQTRLSRAIDIFPEGDPYLAWQIAATSGLFTGVGFYTDTQYAGEPHTMLHLDIRPGVYATLWARVAGEYLYPRNPQQRAAFLLALNLP